MESTGPSAQGVAEEVGATLTSFEEALVFFTLDGTPAHAGGDGIQVFP